MQSECEAQRAQRDVDAGTQPWAPPGVKGGPLPGRHAARLVTKGIADFPCFPIRTLCVNDTQNAHYDADIFAQCVSHSDARSLIHACHC